MRCHILLILLCWSPIYLVAQGTLTAPLEADFHGLHINPAGTVVMWHDSKNVFIISAPGNVTVSQAGSTTSGLQEAIDYAHIKHWPLYVYCGASPNYFGGGGPILTHSSTITFPPGYNDAYYFVGCAIQYTGAPNSPAWKIDSSDMTSIAMPGTQLICPVTDACIDINPSHPNGEGSVAFYANTLDFGTIAVTIGAPPYLPDPTRGTGVHVHVSAVYEFNTISVKEINGGLNGIVIDDLNRDAVFSNNRITASIRGQGGTCTSIGAFETTSVVFGNEWHLGLQAGNSGTCLSTWAGAPFGGDLYELNCTNGATGIIANTGSANNYFNDPTNSTPIPYTDYGTGNYRVNNLAKSARIGIKNFSSLSTCTSATEGDLAAIGDSTTASWGATIAGGGKLHVLAYCDGTSWTVLGR